MKKTCPDKELITWLKFCFLDPTDINIDSPNSKDKFIDKLSDGFYLGENNLILNFNRNKFEDYCIITKKQYANSNSVYVDSINIKNQHFDYIQKTPIAHLETEKIYRIEVQHTEDLSDTIAVVNKSIWFGTREFIISDFIWYRIFKKHHMCYFTIYDVEKNTKFKLKTNFNFFDRIFKYDQGNGTYYFE